MRANEDIINFLLNTEYLILVIRKTELGWTAKLHKESWAIDILVGHFPSQLEALKCGGIAQHFANMNVNLLR